MLNNRNLLSAIFLTTSVLMLSSANADTVEGVTKTWSFSEFATPLYAGAPASLPYANANAPKGGRITLAEIGGFDTMNFHVAKGDWPSSIGILYDSLMMGTSDEIDAYYGELAESVEYPEDYSWAIFNLRKEARYHDGTPVTAKDFVYSLEAKKEHGRTMIKTAYERVEKAEALDDYRVKFYFTSRNTKKPLVQLAGLSPLPVSFWKDRDITKSTLEVPLTSGPYRIKKMEPGRFIIYERDENYWGKDLPLKKGLYNFDQIQYDYYQDETVMFEAFKAGKIDIRAEGDAKRWVTGYELESVKDGEMILAEIPTETPRGLRGFFFNSKREKFSDSRVRQGVSYLFDFEAIQRTVLYGKFSRAKNYFNGAGYSSSGLPEGEELALLESYRDQLPSEVFSKEFNMPVTDGSGRDRKVKRQALKLLKAAGWNLKSGKMIDSNGRQLSLEIITASPDSERYTAPYIDRLKGVGIDATFRVVDSAQWRERARKGDFDLLTAGTTFYPPPGGELKSYFHSSTIGTGSGNSWGVDHPAVDFLVEQVIDATKPAAHYAAMHALDRVLLANHYAVPLYYRANSWVAYWDVFGRPEVSPKYAIGITSTWWIDPDKKR